ncbi:MAG: hypothetical protein IJZ26_00255 [Clostridia bacterium]|nr:hypothetical protein [Clostridia bacterium]
MNFINKVWDKIKEPKGVWLVLFYIFFVVLVAGTIVLVILEKQQTILHFVLYFLSAVSLTYFVYTIVIFTPKIRAKILNFMRKHKFTSELLDNYGYRTIVFSVISFVLNISFVAFMGYLAIKTASVWYISITAYYLFLILLKGILFYSKKKSDSLLKQAKTYKKCGIVFMLLPVVFSGIIVLIYTSNMHFEYAGIMIYAVALFTFYKLTLSIYNLFKAKQHEDLHIKGIRNVNFVSALVSIVVLQVAMFQAFAPEYNTSFANALTGGVVSLVILVFGILMIIKANKIIKATNNLLIKEQQKEVEINDGQ